MIDEGDRPMTLWANVLTHRDNLLSLYTHCLPLDSASISIIEKIFPNEAELFQQRRHKAGKTSRAEVMSAD